VHGEALGSNVHIILVSDRLATAKSLSLSPKHLIATAVALALMVCALAASLAYFSFRHAAEIKLPLLQTLLLAAQHQERDRAQSFVRENLNAMAVKLGEMQAQLMRLDALGERLTTLAGMKPQEFRFSETPGRGGALTASIPPYNLSMSEFSHQLDQLSQRMENRTDYLGIIESRLFDAQVKKKLIPTIPPVVGSTYNASSFGWRIDPFTGMNALH
jgi:hypothetical protein